jgi:Glycosyltransferase
MISVLYDNIGLSFTKVASLLIRGLESIGYRCVRAVSIHSLFYVPTGLAIAVYDTKLYERKHAYVRGAVRGKLVLWLDSPADPSVINPATLVDGCHVAAHPYWYREYKRRGIPVCGWVPRPVDYDVALKVSEQPREELCRDIWAKYGRYIFTVASDNKIAPSKPPRKGLDAYDRLCEEIKRKHDVKCLYAGNWDLRNAVKVSHLGGLSEYELLRLMRCSEAFVWASRSEGFGLPPIEAMSVGAIVVSSNAPLQRACSRH